MANVRKQAQEKGKVERVPFGTVRLKTQLSDADMKEFKRRGMKPRWFNYADGRIERAKAAWYTFVAPEHATSLGQSAIHQGNSDEGSKVSMIAGRGESQLRMYLMEIPIDLWEKDQKAKMDHIDDLEQQDPFEQDGQSGISYGTGVKYSH